MTNHITYSLYDGYNVNQPPFLNKESSQERIVSAWGTNKKSLLPKKQEFERTLYF